MATKKLISPFLAKAGFWYFLEGMIGEEWENTARVYQCHSRQEDHLR